MQQLIYSGSWRRIFAYVIDVILVMLLVSLLIVILSVFFSINTITYLKTHDFYLTFASFTQTVSGVFILFILLMLIFYFPIFESSKMQGSIGKYILGIKVVNLNEERIGFFLACFRLILFTLLCKISMFLTLITVPFTNERKGIHDMICKTRVVRKTN